MVAPRILLQKVVVRLREAFGPQQVYLPSELATESSPTLRAALHHALATTAA